MLFFQIFYAKINLMDIRKILTKQKTFDIASNLPDSVLYIANSGLVEWGNDLACEMFEVSKQLGFVDITVNDILENGFELVSNAEKSKKALIAKSTIKEEYYEITSKQVEGGYVVILRDSTQNYKRISGILAEKESSQHITKDKNEFLVKLANKFNPPLQSIIGFSQGLIDGLGGKTTVKQDKYLNIIKNNSAELAYFFNKLVELSQSEGGLFEKDVKYFDVVGLVEQTIKSVKDNYETKSLNISFNVEQELKRMIYQNEPVFKVIVQNVIESVVREIEIGNILITLSDTTEEFLNARNIQTVPSVLITVSSTNLQITDNELPILFNPYATIEKLNRNSITRALALGTVKNLSKTLGGVVWVESGPMGPVFNIVISREYHE